MPSPAQHFPPTDIDAVATRGSRCLLVSKDRSGVLPGHPGAPEWVRLYFVSAALFGAAMAAGSVSGPATPAFVRMGLSNQALSAVMLAGPVAGLIAQPVVGILSDRCCSRWGRRRPYLLGGGIVFSLAVLGFGWSERLSKAMGGEGSGKSVGLATAITAFWIFQFANNVCVAVSRALIIDLIPASHQASANAWATRQGMFGSLLGFGLGWIDLPSLLQIQEKWTHLEILSIVAVSILVLCGTMTVVTCKETVQRIETVQKGRGLAHLPKDLWRTWQGMDNDLRKVMWIEFFSFIAWGPLLSYAPTWIAGVYTDLTPSATPDGASRAAMLSLFLSSILSTILSVLLPLLVAPSSSIPRGRKGCHLTWMSFPRLWTISMIFAMLLALSTPWASESVTVTTLVETLYGFPWAVSCWVPFAIIGDVLKGTAASSKPSSQNSTVKDIEQSAAKSSDGQTTGSILGLHNVFVVAGQGVGLPISSAVFSLTDPVSGVFRLRSSWQGFVLVFCLTSVFMLAGAAISGAWSEQYNQERQDDAEESILRRSEAPMPYAVYSNSD